MSTAATLLMFEGNATEAMEYYTTHIPDSEITNVSRYEAGEPGTEGTIKHASFKLAGQNFMCIDSAVKHAFSFTPAVSISLSCDTEEMADRLFREFSTGGSILMAFGPYPFAKKFGWLTDRFGVSWQITFNQ